MSALEGADQAQAAQEAEGQGKGKARNVKTPLQKEVLEASYHLNAFPTAQHRKALAERIGLTEEQVQAWFVGKRRRDKKKVEGTPGPPAGTGAAGGAAAAVGQSGGMEQQQQQQQTGTSVPAAAAADSMGGAYGAGYASGADSDAFGGGGGGLGGGATPAAAPGSAPSSAGRRATTPTSGAAAGGGGGVSSVTAELLEAAKATLPVPFREDGPPLSFMFDSVPAPNTKKGMQAAALIAAKLKKLVVGLDPAAAAAAAAGGASEHDDQGPAKRPRLAGEGGVANDDQLAYQQAVQQQAALHAITQAQPQSGREVWKAERERQREEARRQKEMDKARAAAERETKKKEAQADRERRAEEKRKAAEDKRREKELAKALMQQERGVGRGGRTPGAGGGGGHHGPPDDLDVEMEALLVRARATAAAQAAARGVDPAAVEPVVPPRPEFPPPYMMLTPAFPPELGDDLGPQLVEAWGFVTGFCDLLGVPGFSLEMLLSGLLQGASSPLLGLVHTILLRQAQADMEEAHATGVLQSPQIHLCDRALVAAAHRLEEAWAWGLDPDLWRAHLGPMTWPEVLRQQALAAGAGGSRVYIKPPPTAEGADGGPGGPDGGSGCKQRRKFRAPKGSVGFEGEDVVSGWGGDGPLKLQLPLRFGEGTWMAAAWKVLAQAGPEGMIVQELVRIIGQRGYRSLGTSKNPEASVTGALSRDILFARLKPGTYSLQSIVTHHQRMQAAGKPTIIEPPQEQGAAGAGVAAAAGGATAMDADGHHEVDSEEEEESDEEELVARAPEDPADAAPWCVTLKHAGYDALSLSERLAALLWLIGVVVEGPGVRVRLDAREKEVAVLKKQLQEDVRAEKKRRQDEAAARARAAAEEAQRKLEELQSKAAAGETVAPEQMAAAAAAAAALNSAAGGAPGAASRAVTPTPGAGAAAAALPPPAPTVISSAPGKQEQQQQQQEGVPLIKQEEQQQQQQLAVPGSDGQQQEASATAPIKQEQQQQQQDSQQLTATSQHQPQQQQQAEAARAELEAELAAESARRAARAEAIRRCEELNVLRLEPLGMDRRFNRYWLLLCPDFSIASTYLGSAGDFAGDFEGSCAGHPHEDGNAGRIFVECSNSGRWRVMLRPQQLDQLKQALESRGVREGALHHALLRVEGLVRAAMPGVPFAMPKTLDQQPPNVQQSVLSTSSQWMQGQLLQAHTLISSSQEEAIAAAMAAAAAVKQEGAGPEGSEGQAAGPDSQPDVQLLKQDMLRVEALLADTMQHTSSFDHEAWVQAVASAPSLTALRTCLAELETALVNEGQVEEVKGKTRGQLKAESERIPLLSPAWKIVASTPCVKGAWLTCGAEVAAAALDTEFLLQPVQPAGAAGDVAAAAGDPAAAAAADAAVKQAGSADAAKQEVKQEAAMKQDGGMQDRMLLQQQQRQGLAWLPATVPALALRLAALDAVLQYPQLGRERVKLSGRQVMAAYRYIVKPAPIYAPPTLDQLLSQEKAADQQQQQQQSTSSADGDTQQQQEQQEQQQQLEQRQQRRLSDVPSLQQVLSGRVRCVYGYSLVGRGLLQLIRGLPPFPDWLQQARLDEFKLPVESYKKAVQAAMDDGTFRMTIPEIRAAREAEIAKAKAEKEAKAKAEQEAKDAAAAAAAAAQAAAEAAEAAGKGAAAAAAAGGGKGQLPPKGKGGLKIKLHGQAAAAAAVAAKAGKGAAAGAGDKGAASSKGGSSTAAAAAAGSSKAEAPAKQQQRSSNGTGAIAPKLRIKGALKKPESREASRESSPALPSSGPAAAAAGHGQQKG